MTTGELRGRINALWGNSEQKPNWRELSELMFQVLDHNISPALDNDTEQLSVICEILDATTKRAYFSVQTYWRAY